MNSRLPAEVIVGKEDKPVRRSRNRRITESAKETFLEGVRKGLTLTQAADLTPHPYRSFQTVRHRDKEFAEAWNQAVEESGYVVEAEALRRGIEGWLEPVVGKVAPGIDGHVLGPDGKPMFVRKFSDRTLEVLLKGRMSQYKEKGIEITNQIANISVEDKSAAIGDLKRILWEVGVGEGNGGLPAGEGVSTPGGLLAESEDV